METVEFIIGEIVKPVRQIRVLLVDDDAFIHEMMKLYLKNTEYWLISATNARDALHIIDNDPPEILITDAMMPGESGFALIERMKSRPDCGHIPIILWTIMEDIDGVMYASVKADILINKPFYRCDMMEGLERARQMLKPLPDTKNITITIE